MQNREINMLKAAMPYTSPQMRKPMQVVIQSQELSSYIRERDEEAEIGACGLSTVGDVEGMMESVREFCTSAEKETVDLVLNFIRARKLYQAYRSYTTANGRNPGNGNNQMMEFMMSQLSQEQQNSFAQMSSIERKSVG